MSTSLGRELRTKEFDLDEDHVFCNSGSWSCVPRRFLERQSELIRERERNSQLWTFVKEPRLIYESLTLLADFIGASVDNLTFIENTTEGTNIALKNQEYQVGDKILLCNDHVYGAVSNQAKMVVKENEGVELVTLDIPFPIRGKDDIISAYDKVLQQHPGIKITVIDHISCDTAVLFPIKEIAALCHQYGVISVIDGAHAPGQVHLKVEEYGADYYVGNLCKWLMVPQGVGFLWVDPKHQESARPLATSHHCFLPHFRDRFYPPMTKDRICQILVKDALEFLNELGGLDHVTARNSALTTRAAEMLSQAWSTDQLNVSIDCRAPNMAVIAYPESLTEAYSAPLDLMYDLLLNGVTGKVCGFGEKLWCRISCNVWNDWDDFELLCERVKSLVEWKKSRKDDEPRPRYFIPEAT